VTMEARIVQAATAEILPDSGKYFRWADRRRLLRGAAVRR
jgi:hypothetical protein